MVASPGLFGQRIRTIPLTAFALAVWPGAGGPWPRHRSRSRRRCAQQKVGESRRGDPELDQKVNQAREEIELLELQFGTRRAQLDLAEARMAEARRRRANFEKLYRDGFASEERDLASRDDVLMHESRVTAEKAGVQESAWDRVLAVRSDAAFEVRFVVDEEPYLIPLFVDQLLRRRYLMVVADTSRGRIYPSRPGSTRCNSRFGTERP